MCSEALCLRSWLPPGVGAGGACDRELSTRALARTQLLCPRAVGADLGRPGCCGYGLITDEPDPWAQGTARRRLC